MAVSLYGLFFILPSILVGALLARRAKRSVAFVAMLLTFGVTAFSVWGSFRQLFTPEGVFVAVAQVLVALTLVGVDVPLVSKIPAALKRSAN